MTFFIGGGGGGGGGGGNGKSGNDDGRTEIQMYIDAFYSSEFLHGYFKDANGSL